MRFIRFGDPGHEKPGLLSDDGSNLAVDLSSLGVDIDGRCWPICRSKT